VPWKITLKVARQHNFRYRSPTLCETKREIMISEKPILKYSKSSDLTSYGALYDQYASGLWKLILKFTKNELLAAEILQETFVAIWKQREQVDPAKTRLFSWMVSIAIYQCCNRLHLSKTELMETVNYLVPSK
jgi:DNA-directed RNA polymerase specialized sigma24 family protein